jgi:hypothetical protein
MEYLALAVVLLMIYVSIYYLPILFKETTGASSVNTETPDQEKNDIHEYSNNHFNSAVEQPTLKVVTSEEIATVEGKPVLKKTRTKKKVVEESSEPSPTEPVTTKPVKPSKSSVKKPKMTIVK